MTGPLVLQRLGQGAATSLHNRNGGELQHWLLAVPSTPPSPPPCLLACSGNVQQLLLRLTSHSSCVCTPQTEFLAAPDPGFVRSSPPGSWNNATQVSISAKVAHFGPSQLRLEVPDGSQAPWQAAYTWADIPGGVAVNTSQQVGPAALPERAPGEEQRAFEARVAATRAAAAAARRTWARGADPFAVASKWIRHSVEEVSRPDAGWVDECASS